MVTGARRLLDGYAPDTFFTGWRTSSPFAFSSPDIVTAARPSGRGTCVRFGAA